MSKSRASWIAPQVYRHISIPIMIACFGSFGVVLTHEAVPVIFKIKAGTAHCISASVLARLGHLSEEN